MADDPSNIIHDASPYQTPAAVTEDTEEQSVLSWWHERCVDALIITKGFAYGTIVSGSIVLLSVLVIAGWQTMKWQDFRVVDGPLLRGILVFALTAGAFVTPIYVISMFTRRRGK